MKQVLEHLMGGGDLSSSEAEELLVALTGDDMPPALAGALLAALRAKGETAGEVRGFAAAMRRLATKPEIDGIEEAVDIVGTGGDGSHSLNLSTAAALLAAASGVLIVKHGNRAVSSRSGSADVLEQLGFEIPATPEDAAERAHRLRFTFLFAPYFHPAMKALAPIRRAMGVRTVFNILGPLTNPASPGHYVLGAYGLGAAQLMAEALSGMPITRAFVVHGAPAWDEATPVGRFTLFDVRPGSVERTVRDPQDFGIPRCAPESLLGSGPRENASQIAALLDGAAGPAQDAVVLNAALTLEVSGASSSPEEAIHCVRSTIENGTAARFLSALSSAVTTTSGRDG